MTKLSIICPTYNEINFISTLIESLVQDDGIVKEIIIVDGGSTDGTIEFVTESLKIHSQIRLLKNFKKTSTSAFNLAVQSSNAEYISFVGAHAVYPANYFVECIKALDNNECDAVGGFLKQEGKTSTGKAIAFVMSNKFGVGNTEFRTSNKKKYVDSVAFAVYKRDVIESVGLMDETLPINQDDEFHYRLNSRGYKILMLPNISAVYYVRDNYSSLFKQYYRYGFYKPVVLRKVKGALRFRHIIPSVFALYFLSIPLFLFFFAWIVPLILYIVLIIKVSLSFPTIVNIKLRAIPVFPILHFAYGIGFVLGFINIKFRSYE